MMHSDFEAVISTPSIVRHGLFGRLQAGTCLEDSLGGAVQSVSRSWQQMGTQESPGEHETIWKRADSLFVDLYTVHM